MPTRYVNTASTTGGDGTTNATSGANRAYPDLSEAIASEAADLVTLEEDLIILVDGDQDTEPVASGDFSGYTTSSSFQIIVRPNTGNEAGTEWNTGIYRLESSAAGVHQFTASGQFIQVENIQVGRTGNQGAAAITTDGSTGRIRCIGTYMRADNGTTGAAQPFQAFFGPTQELINCIMHQFGGDGSVDHCVETKGDVLYNCTIIANCDVAAIRDGDFANNAGHVKNNVIINNGSGAAWDSSWTPTATDANLTDDATSPDGASFQNASVSFVSSTDFALQSGDTAAKDAGVDLSSDPQYAFSTDILGSTRSGSWDIGAHEVAAASTILPSVNSMLLG